MDSFSFIFLGDTHGFIDDSIKQRELIEEINPEFVLSENLQDISLDSKNKYEGMFKEKKISEMVSFKDVESLINLCYKKKINLIGIDLKNFGFDFGLQQKINKKKSLSKEEISKVNNILRKRSEHHLEMIKYYKKRTKKPLIIILGSWHLRKDSLLMKSLNNYKIIFPCDKKGNLLVKPTYKKDISYCEKIKWKD